MKKKVCAENEIFRDQKPWLQEGMCADAGPWARWGTEAKRRKRGAWVWHTECGSARDNRTNPGPGLRTVQYSSIPMADVDTR